MGEREDIAGVSIGRDELGLRADAPVVELRRPAAPTAGTWEMLGTSCEPRTRADTAVPFRRLPGSRAIQPRAAHSSAARVDDRSIRERKCFLCLPHLPPEQRGILYGDRFMILCNPFPIFPEHFTIPHVDHVPQRIARELGAFLALAHDLAPRYSVFYNGPRCGASAPDHLHFQAGTRQFMPIEGQYARLRPEGKVVRTAGTARTIAIEAGGGVSLPSRGRIRGCGTRRGSVYRRVAGDHGGYRRSDDEHHRMV